MLHRWKAVNQGFPTIYVSSRCAQRLKMRRYYLVIPDKKNCSLSLCPLPCLLYLRLPTRCLYHQVSLTYHCVQLTCLLPGPAYLLTTVSSLLVYYSVWLPYYYQAQLTYYYHSQATNLLTTTKLLP